MSEPDKVIYTAKTHTTGGRDHGAARSSDGHLDVKLTSPGAGGGTNPEQLFAAGWSACFESAMGLVARQMKIALPPDLAIDAEVDLHKAGNDYFLERAAQYQPARHGSRHGDQIGECCARSVPLFQSHARQHRCRDQRRLERDPCPKTSIAIGAHF